MPPTYVVIPVRDQLALTRSVVEQLREQDGYERIVVVDNGSAAPTRVWLRQQYDLDVIDTPDWTITRMWNAAVAHVRRDHAVCNIAFLNNDLRLGPRFIDGLASALRADPALWAVCPNYDDRSVDGVEYITSTFKNGGLAGFAFMVKGEVFDDIAFDEGFDWWFGDDDFVAQVEQRGGKLGLVSDVTVEHVNGGSQTMLTRVPEVYESLVRDWEHMLAKWGHE